DESNRTTPNLVRRRTMNTSEKEALDPTERVASDLVHTMCAANGLNEFFENALPLIAEAFGAKRVMLIDYHENTNHFDLLHFGGYQKQERFHLQRPFILINLKRALTERRAYFLGHDRNRLSLPLYFASTLEALIVLESDLAIELTPVRQQIAR